METIDPPPAAAAVQPAGPAADNVVRSLRDLSPQQWKSGIAAWLGWLFDGLDQHLYVLVSTVFVAQLLHQPDPKPADVNYYSSLIQGGFMVGWALGGGFFGRIGDMLGRSRALMLTILTYALFTGLSFVAQTWWHLLIFRFLSALGIGGEWAIGASLLSETWPARWRPWIAAVLQSAANIGVLVASVALLLMADLPTRSIFLVGVLPALLVLWIRRAVPEPEVWRGAKRQAADAQPVFRDLFRGPVRRITLLTLPVCGLSLTAHWAFLFWYVPHLRSLRELADWKEAGQSRFVSVVVFLVTAISIGGNFVAAWLASRFGYRRAIVALCLAYGTAVAATYAAPRTVAVLACGLAVIAVCHGVFALFTMYLPPLFPTLLRTTGAGFCYNIGRVVAGAGIVFFGLFAQVGDPRPALFYSAFMFLPAAAITCLLPEPPGASGPVTPPAE